MPDFAELRAGADDADDGAGEFCDDVLGGGCSLQEPSVLGNWTVAPVPGEMPAVASQPEPGGWLHEHALQPFLADVRAERLQEVDRIAAHIELSLTELLQKADEEIGLDRALVQMLEQPALRRVEGIVEVEEDDAWTHGWGLGVGNRCGLPNP